MACPRGGEGLLVRNPPKGPENKQTFYRLYCKVKNFACGAYLFCVVLFGMTKIDDQAGALNPESQVIMKTYYFCVLYDMVEIVSGHFSQK